MKKNAVFLVLALFAACLAGISAGAVAVGEVFPYQFDGGNNPTSDGLWVYEWYRESDDTFHTMDWNASGNYFEAQYTDAAASDPHWYCRVRSSGNNMHPGAGADCVKTFVCPEDGEVEFQITATRQSPVTNGNGNSFRLFVNETKVWPAEGDYKEVSDTSPCFIKVALQVKKGDKVRFMVGSLGNSSSDGVNISGHKVTYLSGSNLTSEEKQYIVACIGDSVTEGLTLSGGLKGKTSWPAWLETYLNGSGRGKYRVENYGKSGATLQKEGEKPYTLQGEYWDSLKTEADIIIIGLGANDAKKTNWNAQRYREQYRELISTYLNLPQKPKVYLSYTTYVADQSKTGIQRSVIQGEMLNIQKDLAKELGLKILDLNTLTKNNSRLYNDGVHPNDELAKLMGYFIYNSFCEEEVLGLQKGDAKEKSILLDPALPAAGTSSEPPSSSVTDTVNSTDSVSGQTDGIVSVDSGSPPDSEIPSDFEDSSVTSCPERGTVLWLWLCGGGLIVLGAGVAVFFFIRKKNT